MAVREQVTQLIARHSMLHDGEVIVVAVSGGADSLCLLHLLRELSTEFGVRLHVAHVNHSIPGEESAADATFVVDLAQQWHLPVTVGMCDVPTYAAEHRVSIEEAARQMRYTFLHNLAQDIGAGAVAVGHQADDQAETIVMHLLRGSGARGLRGMRPVSPWPFAPDREVGQKPLLIRPLLHIARTETALYCETHHLQSRFDRSNLDMAYFRNRIRHQLIPVLETFNPAIRDVLRRMGATITDDYDYLQQQVLGAWSILVQESDQTIVFPLAAWQGLHVSIQRGLLREAIWRLVGTLRDIEYIHIEACLSLIREQPAGSIARLAGGLKLYKSQQSIALSRLRSPLSVDVPQIGVEQLPVSMPGTTLLPDSIWRIDAAILSRCNVGANNLRRSSRWIAYLDYAKVGNTLILRPRQPGDQFQPLGLGGQSISIRKFMKNAKIPRDARLKLPLVVSAQHIVWIPGWRLDERVRLTDDTQHVLVLTFRQSRIE